MANELTVTGKFLGAKATESLGQNNFLVRKLYVDLTDNPDYPNTPEFQLTGDKVNLVDNLVKGQMIQVKFRLDGRKVTSREGKDMVITNLRVYKIDVVTTQSAAVAAPQAQALARQTPAPAPAMSGPGQYLNQQAEAGSDDLPF
ncbi:hypothetical protein GCM10028818_00920 [Spirosoma horti]